MYNTKKTCLEIILVIILTVIPFNVFASEQGHKNHDLHSAKPVIENSAQERSGPATGIVENSGEYIPLDLEFMTSKGKLVTLGNLIERPTLLLPVYFSCPSACPLLLADLASALKNMNALPGEEYQVIAFSFDYKDTSDYASQAKKNYLKIVGEKFPDSAWTFLTGSKESIEPLTTAIGFYYKEVAPRQFTHPSILLCLAEDGQIIRYIYGPGFLPLDLNMAINEATKGVPAVSIKKIISFCFSYDPKGKKYVFNTFRVVGITLFLTLVCFYYFVLRKGNK